jgi:5-methylcytosine-specific restriction endonuclease McrA
VTLVTHHGTKTIQDFVDLFAAKRLNLSPAFQRQSVWTARDRRLLINSIFDNMPIPSVYLYRQTGKGGTPLHDVIDGKQRLESILLFMRQGPLRRVEEDLWIKRAFDEMASLEWWAWSDLSDDQRNQFLTAKLPTIEVEGELGEVIELFVRINATGKRLTSQERRHAHYYTNPVLRAGQDLADRNRDFLVRAGVISPAQSQRMRHVELMTELLLAVRIGMPLNKKQQLDQVIQNNGVAAAELKSAATDLNRAISSLKVILPHLKSTRFRQIADFYTLVLLLHRMYNEGLAVNGHASARNKLAGSLLTDFGRGVDEVSDMAKQAQGVTALQEPFRQYLMTVREGTDSRPQREAREKLLRAVLDGVFETRDPTRTFNATQRRILWHASDKKLCSICRKPIARWEDVSVDHVMAYIKGGKTKLSNAALAHKKCNSAKGARWVTRA